MTHSGTTLLMCLLPELLIVVGGCLILLAGLTTRPNSQVPWTFAVLALIAALAAALGASQKPGSALPWLNPDSLAWYARVVTISIGLLVLLASRHVPAPGEGPEFFGLVLFSLAGVSLVAFANDLILLFLALELVSVPTYILVGLSRRDIRAQEATGKYFFLGALAAAITLYGFSFLYGAGGTTTLFGTGHSSIAAALELPSRASDKLTILGLLLTLIGLGFKLAAAPLHFYVADVYQGAASPVTGMLGFVPKFAGLIALIRILSLFGWVYTDSLFWLLWGLAAATMLVGNTLALMQHNVKRMLAYSSVAHSGYMLVGLAAGPGTSEGPASTVSNGIGAILFYVTVYGVMNLGAFAALSFFRKPGTDEEDSAETLDDLAGSARTQPWPCLALAICVLSLMGLPPTGGFFGKLYVFSAALSSDVPANRQGPMLALVIIGVLNSAIAAAYYLRIIAACFIRVPKPEDKVVSATTCGALRFCIAACALIVLGLFLNPSSLLNRSREAASGIRQVVVESRDSSSASALAGTQ